MTRDDEYTRDLLLMLEAYENPWFPVYKISFPEGEFPKALHHLDLLTDKGFLVGNGKNSVRLSNDGHDFVAAIRDEGIWTKTKNAVAETGGNATLEILKALALGFLKKKVSEQTGIEI